MQTATKEQTWSSAVYGKNARFVSELGAGILDWLEPQSGERVLDLGCGDGHLTQKIANAGARVVGVDSSESFVQSAQELGLDARVHSGEALPFDGEFDAVFSNAALHWMTDAPSVVDGIYRALKPGGRFVAEFGGHGNVAAIVTALRAMAHRHGIDETLAHVWYFPTPDEYRALLSERGFEVERIELMPRPTFLPTGLRGWIETFRMPFFHAAGEKASLVLDDVEALLAPVLRSGDGRWIADYVRLRVIAHRVAA
ncbi:MAG: methyltransferase domain-containing protein [Pseudomonadota bacterium]